MKNEFEIIKKELIAYKPYSVHWKYQIGYLIFFEYDDSMTWKDAIFFGNYFSSKSMDDFCAKLNGAYLMGISKTFSLLDEFIKK